MGHPRPAACVRWAGGLGIDPRVGPRRRVRHRRERPVLHLRGHEVWGLDFVLVAIERASAKAKERGWSSISRSVTLFKLDQLSRTFDTVIDCGLFHTFSDEERPLYVAGLTKVVRPGGHVHILCFSDQEPPGQGPRLITQDEIRDAFRDGWEVTEIRDARFQTT